MYGAPGRGCSLSLPFPTLNKNLACPLKGPFSFPLVQIWIHFLIWHTLTLKTGNIFLQNVIRLQGYIVSQPRWPQSESFLHFDQPKNTYFPSSICLASGAFFTSMSSCHILAFSFSPFLPVNFLFHTDWWWREGAGSWGSRQPTN